MRRACMFLASGEKAKETKGDWMLVILLVRSAAAAAAAYRTP